MEIILVHWLVKEDKAEEFEKHWKMHRVELPLFTSACHPEQREGSAFRLAATKSQIPRFASARASVRALGMTKWGWFGDGSLGTYWIAEPLEPLFPAR